ncbi:MAG: N-acetylmuramoyl-L-alanine amidase [Thermodesulfobacteriota bacterium]
MLVRTIPFVFCCVLMAALPALCASKVSREAPPTFEESYKRLEALRRNPATDRAEWLRVIRSFERIYTEYGKDPNGLRGLHFASRAAHDLYERSKKREDLNRANRYARESRRLHAEGRTILVPSVRSRVAGRGHTWVQPTNAGRVAVQPLPVAVPRVEAREPVSRPVMETRKSTRFDRPASASNPPVKPAVKAPDNRAPAPQGANPFWSASQPNLAAVPMPMPRRASLPPVTATDAAPRDNAPKQASKRFTVVIDPGHGGKDPGAVSPDGLLLEKDVTLQLAKAIKARLERSNPRISVALTRTDDRFLTLKERTAFANSLDADLFLSVHCNSAHDASPRGIETYYLSSASSKKAMAVAARENEIPLAQMTDIQATLLDLIVTSKQTESIKLAESVHRSLIRHMAEDMPAGDDRETKSGPFYVLLGAKMPSILVECAFLSNATERRKLTNQRYIGDLAAGIAKGARDYLSGWLPHD